MVQKKVGQMQSCCLLVQSPERGRGYTSSSHSIPILREFFMWKEENTIAKVQQKKKKKNRYGGKVGNSTKFSGKRKEWMLKQAYALPRRGVQELK